MKTLHGVRRERQVRPRRAEGIQGTVSGEFVPILAVLVQELLRAAPDAVTDHQPSGENGGIGMVDPDGNIGEQEYRSRQRARWRSISPGTLTFLSVLRRHQERRHVGQRDARQERAHWPHR
jgi:hypothetical protein